MMIPDSGLLFWATLYIAPAFSTPAFSAFPALVVSTSNQYHTT